jgi:hypothetical protein
LVISTDFNWWILQLNLIKKSFTTIYLLRIFNSSLQTTNLKIEFNLVQFNPKLKYKMHVKLSTKWCKMENKIGALTQRKSNYKLVREDLLFLLLAQSNLNRLSALRFIIWNTLLQVVSLKLLMVSWMWFI